MQGVVSAARAGRLSDHEIAELALVLAASGEQLSRDGRAADIASTGGPSSLSTLLCPLQLRARGLVVPTLGVPGRPAGGVDALQTIDGFRATLDVTEAVSALRRFGAVHLLADVRWAPLDARLFLYRQRTGAQAIPSLVIASILAKKLAAGAVGVGLEVRVASHGNFGGTLEEARANARRFNAVARVLDLSPACALTDATRPYQPFIGRGEALVALADVLAGLEDPWLAAHVRLCQRMTDAVAGAMGVDVDAPVDATGVSGAHDALLQAHGTERAAFERRVEFVRQAPRTIGRAEHASAVTYDLRRLRTLLVDRQQADQPAISGAPPDPAGVVLSVPADTLVEAGEPLISIRVPEGEDRLAGMLAACASTESGGTGSGREQVDGDDRPRAGTLEII